MKVGITGLANSGKSTIFNSLTRLGVPTPPYAATSGEAHLGMAMVPDERVDRLTVTYSDAADLFRDLTLLAARNSLAARRATLTGRRRFEAMRASLEAPGGPESIAVGLELVYGHCWGAGAAAGGGEIRVDAARIPRRG